MDTGLLFNTDRMSGAALIEYAQQAESTGIDCIWLPELFGREPFVTAAAMLSATRSIRVASGIANVYARDAIATKAAATTLAELYDGRFELGLGVSNDMGNSMRGHEWLPPLVKLTQFFDAMDQARLALRYEREVPVYLAAHGPKLMGFAARRADGANTYLMTPQYTARAREWLGPDKRLIVMQQCLVSETPEQGRSIARKAIHLYLQLDNYHRAWSAQGFTDADYADGGSDRLVDAIVAWGSTADVRARIDEHRASGADQVVVIPINADNGALPDWRLLEALTA